MNWTNKKATAQCKSRKPIVGSFDKLFFKGVILQPLNATHMDIYKPRWATCWSRCTNIYFASMKMYHIQVYEIMQHCSCVGTPCTEWKGISQYCVGRQNRFTKSFMGELPLLDQSLPQSLQLASVFCLDPHGAPLSAAHGSIKNSVAKIQSMMSTECLMVFVNNLVMQNLHL